MAEKRVKEKKSQSQRETESERVRVRERQRQRETEPETEKASHTFTRTALWAPRPKVQRRTVTLDTPPLISVPTATPAPIPKWQSSMVMFFEGEAKARPAASLPLLMLT